MSAPARARYGLLDTSVLVAAEVGRAFRTESFPETASTSIVTVGELRAGIHAAPDVESRDRRIATYELAMAGPVIPIDAAVANAWSQMRTYLTASGGSVNVNDVWIAATAASREIPVVTQDHDFYALSGVAGLTVIEV
ncbi:MAG TPA: PIN domain-containing protein [Solirubrobacterales bacterium]|nr:PIN domain-containing protein [Solirubrobacterales bacterium]